MTAKLVTSFYEKFLSVFTVSKRDAYVCYDERYSYAQMYDNMLKLNSLLKEYQNQRVVIYSQKNFPNYCAVFATLLSGNTWVPMNSSLPSIRVLEMMKLAEPTLILTDQDLPDDISAFVCGRGIQVYLLAELLDANPKTEFDLGRLEPENDAIIYFTSGSTGVPKGVPLTHANYVPTIENILNLLPFNEGEVFADYHDLGFVISVPILFPCVMTQSAVSPARNEMDTMMPGNHLSKNRVTVLITVPSTISRIRRLRPDGLPGVHLNILISCGEPLHLDILDYCLNQLNANFVNNFYGSTEVSPWTFRHECKPEDLERFARFGVIPIGKLLAGTRMRVSEHGELIVSGPQVTAGYLNNVNPDAFERVDGEHWFKTGDKVVPFEDVWLCKGRLDSQVKISGYRVELTDTEAHLRAMKSVESAICFTGGEADEKFIVAVLHSKDPVDVNEVREFLSKRLPSYMIPRQVITKANMPLNKSGKIDRAGLKASYSDGSLMSEAAPRP